MNKVYVIGARQLGKTSLLLSRAHADCGYGRRVAFVCTNLVVATHTKRRYKGIADGWGSFPTFTSYGSDEVRGRTFDTIIYDDYQGQDTSRFLPTLNGVHDPRIYYAREASE